MPDVVDAQLRLQFLGRDVMLPSVMASDPADDPNALPVEALKKPHHDVLSIYNPLGSGQPRICGAQGPARRAERDRRLSAAAAPFTSPPQDGTCH
jgi:hypothetical protein